MTVLRIVANIAAADPAAAQAFYGDILGLTVVMDYGWITTYASAALATAQVSIASEGGSGTPVPDLSIEVDDLADVIDALARRSIAPVYGPVDEPWGVRRLYVRDPFGRVINVLQHIV